MARPILTANPLHTVIGQVLAQMVANAISALGIVAVSYAFAGRWPPAEIIVGSSIGGAMSPFVWRMYRVFRQVPGKPREVDPRNTDTEPVAAADSQAK